MASQSTTGPELIHLGITNSDVRGASEGLGGGELAVVGPWVHRGGNGRCAVLWVLFEGVP